MQVTLAYRFRLRWKRSRKAKRPFCPFFNAHTPAPPYYPMLLFLVIILFIEWNVQCRVRWWHFRETITLHAKIGLTYWWQTNTLLCLRTTIRLNDQLLIEIKQYAAGTGQTVAAVIEDALRQMIDRQKQSEKRKKVKLFKVLGNGTLPGVDLDDSVRTASLGRIWGVLPLRRRQRNFGSRCLFGCFGYWIGRWMDHGRSRF